MGSCAGCVSVEWATKGVLESLALSGSDTRVAASAALVSERRQGLSPCLRLVFGVWRQRVSSGTSGRRRTEGCAVRVRLRAAAMLAHTVSLGVGMLRGLLERAILLFSIVDLTSVNGAAFRQVRVACETHTGVFELCMMYAICNIRKL
eukprot:scaffold8307_cov119-Isochrysis_galbana.AAC.15